MGKFFDAEQVFNSKQWHDYDSLQKYSIIHQYSLKDRKNNRKKACLDILKTMFKEIDDRRSNGVSWLLIIFAQKWAHDYGEKSFDNERRVLIHILKNYDFPRADLAYKCSSVKDIVIIMEGLEALLIYLALGLNIDDFGCTDYEIEGLFEGKQLQSIGRAFTGLTSHFMGTGNTNPEAAYSKHSFAKLLQRVDNAYDKYLIHKLQKERDERQKAKMAREAALAEKKRKIDKQKREIEEEKRKLELRQLEEEKRRLALQEHVLLKSHKRAVEKQPPAPITADQVCSKQWHDFDSLRKYSIIYQTSLEDRKNNRKKAYLDILKTMFKEIDDRHSNGVSWLLTIFTHKWTQEYGEKSFDKERRGLIHILRNYDFPRADLANKCSSVKDIVIIMEGLEALLIHLAHGLKIDDFGCTDYEIECLFEGKQLESIGDALKGLASHVAGTGNTNPETDYSKHSFAKLLQRVDNSYDKYLIYKLAEARQHEQLDMHKNILNEKEKQLDKLATTLADKEVELAHREKALGKKEKHVEKLTLTLADKKVELTHHEQTLGEKEKQLEALTLTLNDKEIKLAHREQALDKKEKQQLEREKVFNRQLDDTKHNSFETIHMLRPLFITLNTPKRVNIERLTIWPDNGLTMTIAEEINAKLITIDDERIATGACPIEGVISYFINESTIIPSDCSWVTKIYLLEINEKSNLTITYPFIHSLCRFGDGQHCKPIMIYGVKLRSIIEEMTPFGNTEHFLANNGLFSDKINDESERQHIISDLSSALRITTDFIAAKYFPSPKINVEDVAAAMYGYVQDTAVRGR